MILWPDTFNNHFTPAVAKAAVEVLEHAGYQVRVPKRTLCCGRPLYDYGFLSAARRLLLETLNALREPLRQGIPVVGLEPSCISVFRDELPNLLEGDKDAGRLREQALLLSEFLQEPRRSYAPPRLSPKAVVHGHCHHKSVLDFESETALLEKAGLECEVPPSGCCGMAGSFGYEADHYQVGLQCGERVLLPAVRNAAADVLIVADGFSCREMIRQETRRRALHCAQVLQMAMTEGAAGPPGPFPEKKYAALEHTTAWSSGMIAAGALACGGLWWLLRKHR